jgi:short-subunit dehydrogenase
MLSEALNYELKKDGVTVTALCPGPTQTEFFIRNDMSSTNVANGPWLMNASDVARAGYAGLMKGKMIVIPGLINKFLAFSVRFTPRRVTAAIVCYLNQK